VRDQVSNPQNTTVKIIIILNIVILRVLMVNGKTREVNRTQARGPHILSSPNLFMRATLVF